MREGRSQPRPQRMRDEMKMTYTTTNPRDGMKRTYCITCHRKIEDVWDRCLHGSAPAPEPWDGGLSMSAEDIAKEYEISLDEAQKIYDSAHRADERNDLAGVVDGIRYKIGEIRYLDGSVQRVALSLETCRCGHSFARDGVGYINYILQAWECKRCGDGHTPYRVVSDDEYMAEQKAILDALGVNQYAGVSREGGMR